MYRVVRYGYRNRKTWDYKRIIKFNCLLEIFSIGVAIAFIIRFFVTFMDAWLNGGSIVFSINDFHEGDYEMIMMLTLVPLVIYDLIRILKSRIMQFFE